MAPNPDEHIYEPERSPIMQSNFLKFPKGRWMMSNLSSRRYFAVLATVLVLVIFLASTFVQAQTTISTGSIVGTVTDATGAVVGGAKVVITNKGTSQAISLTTTSSGTFASGALTPGEYTVRIE